MGEDEFAPRQHVAWEENSGEEESNRSPIFQE